MNNTKTVSRILMLLLALVFTMGIFYATADKSYADGEYEGTVTISLSDDGRFVVSDGAISGVVMAGLEVSLQDVADVDLREWGLEKFAYVEYGTENEPDFEVPTALKLYLYLLENYYGSAGSGEALRTSGDRHSFFMETFWGHDCNLLYYVNGTYPLYKPGWGATADGIRLYDGDFADIAMYTNWGFYAESNAGFNYFAESNSYPQDGAITHNYDAVTGEPLKVQVIRGMGNIDVGEDTSFQAADELPVFWGEEIDLDADTETFLENGTAEITFDKPGEYYVWVEGGAGDESGDPCSCAAYAKVTVTGEPVNKAPRLAPGTSKEVSKSINPATTYSLDLSEIFVDDDKDDLTYKVSVDGADYAAAEKSYKYTPSGEGNITLKFKANDGKVDSEDIYTVKLTVSSSVPKPAKGIKVVDKDCNVYPVYEMIDYDTVAEYRDADIHNYTMPAYKVVLPAAMDFDVIEEAGKWVFVGEGENCRNVMNLAKNWEWIMDMDNVSRYSISRADYAGSELELDKLFNIPGERATSYGFKENEYYDEYWDPLKKLTAIEVYGASNSQTKIDEGIESYWLFIEYDKNVKPSTEENGHELKKVEKKEPTCEEDGYQEYWECSVCKKKFADAKAKHTIEAPMVINGGHKWANPTYQWNADYTKVTATRVCKNDDSHVETETVGVASKEDVMLPHCMRQGRATITSEAFNNEAFKVQKKNVDTPLEADKHDWGDVTFEWNEDNTKVTATRVCSRNPEHVENETADVTSEVTKSPTCTEKGETTYTANFNHEAFETQSKTLEDVEALDHDWDEGEETTASDCDNAGVKTFTCKRDGCRETKTEAIDAKGHTWNSEKTVDKKATCTTEGEKSTHCHICDAIDTGSIEKVPATGHNWGEWKVTKAATTSEEGQETRVCENDSSHKETRSIPKVKEETKQSSDDPKVTPAPGKAEDQQGKDSSTTNGDQEETAKKAEEAKKYADKDKITPSDATIDKKAKVDKKLAINAGSVTTSAKTKKKTMTIKWKKVKKATNYRIAYRQAGKEWKYAWTKGKNTYTLKKLKKNGLYEFKLQAVRKNGSTWTKSKFGKVNYRFYATGGKKVKAGNKGLNVTVKKVKGATGYEVVYSTSKTMKPQNIKAFKGASKTKLAVKGLKKGKTYYVRTRPYKVYKGHKYIGVLNTANKTKVK